MRKHATFFPGLLIILLLGCQSNTTDLYSPPRGRVESEGFTPAEAGYIHNEILREIDVEYPFLSTTDTLTLAEFAALVAEKANDVAHDNEIPESVTTQEVLGILDDFMDYAEASVFDFFGIDVANPGYFVSYQYEEEESLSEEEKTDFDKILQDDDWDLDIGTLDTDRGKQAHALRDSSRSFWVGKGLVSSSDDFAYNVDWYSLGIIVSDALGGIAATAASGGNPYASIVGAALASAAFSLVAYEPEGCGGDGCTGGGGSWKPTYGPLND